jgi:hypothetical protein
MARSNRDLIYSLLGYAFDDLQARVAGVPQWSATVAALVAQVPAELGRAIETGNDCDELLGRLRVEADKWGLGKWLQDAIAVEVQNRSSESCALIHRLLHICLIDLRAEAYQVNERESFAIADIFHRLPLQLLRANRGAESYDQILVELRERARQRGLESWVDTAVAAVSGPHSRGDQI